jgi:dimethylglycine catabolism B
MLKTPPGKDIECCVYCPTLCLSRCPVGRASGNVGLSPQSKQLSMWRVRKKLVKPTINTLAPAHYCLDCLACREACDHRINVPSSLAAGRVELSRQAGHLVPAEACNYDEEAAWQRLKEVAPSWRRVDQCQALLVPGIEMLREDTTDLLEALFRALDKLGDLVVGVTRDSVRECGHHPYALGHQDLAEDMAKTSRKRFARYSKVVFASPHCASFVRLKWPEAGLHLDKQYATLLEFLGRRIDFSRAGFYDRKVTYHDPCNFGRHLGLYQLPRDVLKWATNSKAVEMLYNRERAVCCGGGYPVPEVDRRVADDIAASLMGEAVATGAEEMVVACAQCRSQLQRVEGGIPVRHLLEVLSEVEA